MKPSSRILSSRFPAVGRLVLVCLVTGWINVPIQSVAAAETLPAPPPPRQPRLQAHEELPPLPGEGWKAMFDGKTLDGWKVTPFAGHGEVEVVDGNLMIGMGAMLSGVNGPTNLFRTNYELVVDAKRTMGSDFFCALTFPVGDTSCSLVVGGWGGGVVGISSLDDMDASMNETTLFLDLRQDQWYRIRVRVTLDKIEAWMGTRQIVDVKRQDRKISVRPGEIEMSQPFGIATYMTAATLRNLHWRPLD